MSGRQFTRHGARKRARRAVPGLVFAYVFFLFFPHFAALTHVHENGERAHHHAFLSAHDLALEREVLEAAPQGDPDGELAPEDSVPKILSLPLPGETVRPSTPRAHTHFQEDPNLPVLPSSAVVHMQVVSANEISGSIPGFVPALAILASPARAPPAG